MKKSSQTRNDDVDTGEDISQTDTSKHGAEIFYDCPLCPEGETQMKLSNLKRHSKTVHKIAVLRNAKRKTYGKADNENDKVSNTKYICFCCFVGFNCMQLYKSHFSNDHLNEENITEEDNAESSLITPDTIEMPKVLSLLSKNDISPLPSSELLFKQLEQSTIGEGVPQKIIELLGFVPVCYADDEDSIRFPYFSTKNIVKRSLEIQEQYPQKKFRIATRAANTTSEKEDRTKYDELDINFIINTSPYRRHLMMDSFVPMEDQHIDILNSSWEKRVFSKAASVQLLAGCIVVTGNCAIMVNCLEIYSRLSNYDAHAEQDTSYTQSSIPTIYSQYTEFSIQKIQDDNSVKLVFGTQISNALVTSSIRLDDASISPELGPSTKNFNVNENTRIFLSQDSIKKCNDLLEAKEAQLVLKHEIYNLKQVRSKFHRSSTYTFSRGFSIYAHSLNNTPITIYTAQDSKHITNKDAKISSGILREVAWGVLLGENRIRLSDFKKCVASQESKVSNSTVSLAIQSIEDMFENEDYLNIIGNDDLNGVLEILARFVANNGISSANLKVAESIHTFFRS